MAPPNVLTGGELEHRDFSVPETSLLRRVREVDAFDDGADAGPRHHFMWPGPSSRRATDVSFVRSTGSPFCPARASACAAFGGAGKTTVLYAPAGLTLAEPSAPASASSPTFLADEPTASLDRSAGERLIGDFVTLLCQRGATIVGVSQDRHLLERTDSIITIEDGVLAAAPRGPAPPSA